MSRAGRARTTGGDRARPLLPRFRVYLAERFPLVAYTLLVGALVLAVVSVGDARAAAVTLGLRELGAVLVALLVFFHLRVFDDQKDAAADRVAYPERALSRGVVTLPELTRGAAVAVLVEAGLAWTLGTEAFVWWGAAFVFTMLLRAELFMGAFLRRHVVILALSHNPIVLLLVLFIDASHRAGRPLEGTTLWLGALATFTSLGFELGRKLRAPADERAGQATYTSALGLGRAAASLVAVEGLAALSAIGLGIAYELGVVYLVAAPALALLPAGLALRFARSPSRSSAKATKGAATAVALLLYVLTAAVVIATRGVRLSLLP